MKPQSTSMTSGRRGGKARSPSKSLAARQNILLRWHARDQNGVIPKEALIDGAWYQGCGRTSPIALWDETTHLFHALGWSNVADPENYPAVTKRIFRLKQERHAHVPGGSFKPLRLLPISHEQERGN